MPTAFLTDSTICIGCKACEVACKEWNDVPGDGFNFTGFSYDNTAGLGHSTWRHVKFVERGDGSGRMAMPDTGATSFAGTSRPMSASTARTPAASRPARPDRSSARNSAASSFSLTSATAAATASSPVRSVSSIAGLATGGRSSARSATTGRRPAWSLRVRRHARPSRFNSAISTISGSVRHTESPSSTVAELRMPRCTTAWGRSVGGTHAIFIFRGRPEEYNLPPAPEVPTVHLRKGWTSAAIAAGLMLIGTAVAFLSGSQQAD